MTLQPGVSGNPRGMKPKRLTDEQLELVTKLAMMASHEHTFAHQLGISTPTWRKLRDNDKRVRRAYEAGKGKEHDFWMRSLQRQAERSPIPAIFALKSRHGYNDQPQASADAGPRIVINLPGAARSVEDFKAPVVTVEPERVALPDPAESK